MLPPSAAPVDRDESMSPQHINAVAVEPAPSAAAAAAADLAPPQPLSSAAAAPVASASAPIGWHPVSTLALNAPLCFPLLPMPPQSRGFSQPLQSARAASDGASASEHLPLTAIQRAAATERDAQFARSLHNRVDLTRPDEEEKDADKKRAADRAQQAPVAAIAVAAASTSATSTAASSAVRVTMSSQAPQQDFVLPWSPPSSHQKRTLVYLLQAFAHELDLSEEEEKSLIRGNLRLLLRFKALPLPKLQTLYSQARNLSWIQQIGEVVVNQAWKFRGRFAMGEQEKSFYTTMCGPDHKEIELEKPHFTEYIGVYDSCYSCNPDDPPAALLGKLLGRMIRECPDGGAAHVCYTQHVHNDKHRDQMLLNPLTYLGKLINIPIDIYIAMQRYLARQHHIEVNLCYLAAVVFMRIYFQQAKYLRAKDSDEVLDFFRRVDDLPEDLFSDANWPAVLAKYQSSPASQFMLNRSRIGGHSRFGGGGRSSRIHAPSQAASRGRHDRTAYRSAHRSHDRSRNERSQRRGGSSSSEEQDDEEEEQQEEEDPDEFIFGPGYTMEDAFDDDQRQWELDARDSMLQWTKSMHA